MALKVTSLHLNGFRNFLHREVDLSPATTILVGLNAVGKTNTVEALQLLTSGMSFRNPKPQELINQSCEQAYITAYIEGDGRSLDVSCEISAHKRQFYRNDKKCHTADILGTLRSVMFCPDDLLLIKQSAKCRRDELDMLACQLNKQYYTAWKSFKKTLEQRNSLLKSGVATTDMLDIWDESLAQASAYVLQARYNLFVRLADQMQRLYPHISDRERLSCAYSTELAVDLEHATKDDIITTYRAQLEESRAQDLRRERTCIGIHHDDLQFYLDGADARLYASQGQQRSLVLALKLAQVHLCYELLQEYPLLLLDDVMSELDEHRRSAIFSLLQQDVQTVITTTNLGYFSANEQAQAHIEVYHV